MSKQRDSTSTKESLPVPEQLLTPLLDAAAETFTRMDAGDAPSVLRTLTGFDRRGLSSTTARQQLRKAIDLDDDFRDAVVERFCSRPAVEKALDAWSIDTAHAQI